jgi:hypothetical protein
MNPYVYHYSHVGYINSQPKHSTRILISLFPHSRVRKKQQLTADS